jgi:S1-C subfamily serine protease
MTRGKSEWGKARSSKRGASIWGLGLIAAISLTVAAWEHYAGPPAIGSTVGQATASEGVPVTTRWTLDAAGPGQQNSLTSVYLVTCQKTQIKGTGFLLTSGIVVTNEHVVRDCAHNELQATSSLGETVEFKNSVVDPRRDLALLRPARSLKGGLKLGEDANPPLETRVTTWGFPLSYNGPPPLLSVGYVAGYTAATDGGIPVRHIVVNGAFNPGNSGGPLFVANDNRVVGVVVSKWKLLSQNAPMVIRGLRRSATKTSGTFSLTMPDGTVKSVSNEEAVASVLEEFYNRAQVVIGEAIAVSELKAFIAAQPNF